MVEPTQRIDRAEFESVTQTLVARAKRGTGQVARVAPDDAEDVVQDAWEKELRKKKQLPRGPNLLAHVNRALADTSVDHRRRELRKREVPANKRVPLELAPEAEEVVGGDTEDQVLAALRAREIFEAARSRLDPQAVQFAILDTLDFEEKEAAEAMGASPLEAGAARKRVRRAGADIARAINHELARKLDDPKEGN
jgi:DNA-directed RNA polymerase specialized sigma24 family protein